MCTKYAWNMQINRSVHSAAYHRIASPANKMPDTDFRIRGLISISWRWMLLGKELIMVEHSSVQLKMVLMCLEKPVYIYALHPVSQSEVFLTLPLKQIHCSIVHLIDDGPLSSFQERLSSASSFHTFLLQVIDGVMSLALCPQVVSQASQHFRSSKKQATCEGCFASQSICSTISLHSGMSKGQYTHRSFWKWTLTIDTFHYGLSIPFFTFEHSPCVTMQCTTTF